MAMFSIGCDDLIVSTPRRGNADDDRLLADIEMAEPTDESHAV